MKKFKAIASKEIENVSTKKITKKSEFKSYKFTFFARNFADAWDIAEKEAKKGLSLFTTLTVRKI